MIGSRLSEKDEYLSDLHNMHVAHYNLAKGYRGGTLKASALVTIVVLTILVCCGSALRYQAFSESVVDKYPHGDAARFLVYAYNLKNFGVYGKSDLTLLPADTDTTAARNMLRTDGVVKGKRPAECTFLFSR